MSARSGSLSIVCIQFWDHENCLLYGVAGCPLFRGCLSIEVNGRTVGNFQNCILWVSAVQGCLLSWVPLYM